MEKSAAFIIATAIVVAGLIVAAAVLFTPRPGRYEHWTQSGNVMSMLDTGTGTVWMLQITAGRGEWASFPQP